MAPFRLNTVGPLTFNKKVHLKTPSLYYFFDILGSLYSPKYSPKPVPRLRKTHTLSGIFGIDKSSPHTMYALHEIICNHAFIM